MKSTVFAALLLFSAISALGQTSKTPSPKPEHGYWMAVNNWDDDQIEAETRIAYADFVLDNHDPHSYDVFRLCMAHVQLAQMAAEKAPTSEHLKQCDRVIDHVVKPAGGKW